MHFADRLDAAIKAKGNPICLGLDPRFTELPQSLTAAAIRQHGQTVRAVAESFITFNRAILDALCDLVPVCKPQIAFYEEFGAEGLRAYEATIQYAHKKGLLVISDAKRGDIGSTAVAYARAHLGGESIRGVTAGFDADALTVNPYLGRETLAPYLEVGVPGGRGIFVLVKTSNPGSGDLQDLLLKPPGPKPGTPKPVYEHVAEMVHDLGRAYRGECGLTDVGAVVGATYPEVAHSLREIMPDTILLIPGFGAQGGRAKDAVAGFREDGRGAIVNNSRGILFAYKQEPYAKTYGERDFAGAARAATLAMAAELKTALAAARETVSDSAPRRPARTGAPAPKKSARTGRRAVGAPRGRK